MRRSFRAHLALLASLALAPVAMAAGETGQAVFVGDAGLVDNAGDVQPIATANIDANVEPAQLTVKIGGPGANLGLTRNNCDARVFFGAEYLSVRTTFSEAIAGVRTDIASDPPSVTYEQFNFDYGDSYRLYGGYRMIDCGCDLTFGYTGIDSGGSFASGPQAPGFGNVFTSPFEVVTGGTGDEITGTANTSIDSYDLGISRAIPLGSPLGCCCVDPCACWCPAWDIVATCGLRHADVDSQLAYASNIVSTGTPGLGNRIGGSNVSFQGFGLRAGGLARRYFGRDGIASIYVRGDISLLLGEVENTTFGDPAAFISHSMKSTQVVPVTEIEAGGTIFLTSHTTISAGYLLGAWHDLGHRAMYDFGVTGVQLEGFDDANLMTVDGWFIRGEMAF